MAIGQITAGYAAQIAALEGLSAELRALQEQFDVSAYQPERSSVTVDDSHGSWLLDSNRSYLEQMLAYKRYADGPREAEGEL